MSKHQTSFNQTPYFIFSVNLGIRVLGPLRPILDIIIETGSDEVQKLIFIGNSSSDPVPGWWHSRGNNKKKQ